MHIDLFNKSKLRNKICKIKLTKTKVKIIRVQRNFSQNAGAAAAAAGAAAGASAAASAAAPVFPHPPVLGLLEF